MSLELTARLTLSSCVSQLTDFYTTNIQELFVEQGIQPLTITTCEKTGEVLPYTIGILPISLTNDYSKYTHLEVTVTHTSVFGGSLGSRVIFKGELHRNGMTIAHNFKCALHLAGDYIKFSEKGL